MSSVRCLVFRQLVFSHISHIPIFRQTNTRKFIFIAFSFLNVTKARVTWFWIFFMNRLNTGRTIY